MEEGVQLVEEAEVSSTQWTEVTGDRCMVDPRLGSVVTVDTLTLRCWGSRTPGQGRDTSRDWTD